MRLAALTAAAVLIFALWQRQAAAAAPNDPFYLPAWHHQTIGSEAAWDISGGSRDIVVAVIDTGIDATHPELAGQLVSGWNVANNTSNTSPIAAHGTAVAGVIAAARNNAMGVAGLADVSIMPIIASDSPTSITDLDAAAGIRWAADHGARVINISAGLQQGQRLGEAAQYAWSRGALVVIATNNTNNYTPQFPWDEVITVSASNRSDARHNSQWGVALDLLAPGQDIYTTFWEPAGINRYAIGQGSSFAAPMVSAAAALAWSINPELTNTEVRDLIYATAFDLGEAGYDEPTGWGRLDLGALATATAATVPEPGAALAAALACAMLLQRRRPTAWGTRCI